MSRTISSLLNAHPVNRKDNLHKIASALHLDLPQENKNAQLQSAIEEFLKSEPELESLVRNIAQTIIQEGKLTKPDDSVIAMDTEASTSGLNVPSTISTLSRSPIRVISTPTPPSAIDTQADLFDCESNATSNHVSNLENDLKRKLFLISEGGDCDGGGDGNDDDDDDDEYETKRPRVEPYESIRQLTTILMNEREDRQKEVEANRFETKLLSSKLDYALNELLKLREDVAQIHETVLTKIDVQQPQQQQTAETTSISAAVGSPTAIKTAVAPAIMATSPTTAVPSTAAVTTATPTTTPTTSKTATTTTTTATSTPTTSTGVTTPPVLQKHQQNKPDTKPKVLLISDSNSKYLKLPRLKPEAKVVKVGRFTTTEATDSVPEIESPDEVKDIVFQVGLNDLRQSTPNNVIQEKYLNMQIKYHQKYPNARHHIMAVPPLANRHNDLNRHLQRLSKFTGSNFITTDPLRDRNTGKIRRNLMEDNKIIHYNEDGIKIVAREIKRSLYSTFNRDNNQLSLMAKTEIGPSSGNTPSSVPQIDSANTNNAAITPHLTPNIANANQFSALSVEQ